MNAKAESKMGLKEKFVRWLARADGAPLRATGGSPLLATMEGNNTLAGRINVPGSSRPLENAIMAFACIVCRREAIGGREPLVTTGDNDVIETGALYDLLQQPNADQDWAAFVRQAETHLTLHNVCATHCLKDPVRPEINLLHPDGLRAQVGVFLPTGTPRVVAWDYIDPTTGQARTFQRDEVVIRTGYNPHAPMGTLSPLKVLERTLKGDIAAREQNLGLFLNDATPRGYLHTDQAATREQMESVLDVWNKTYQGYLNAHKTAALWGGVKHDKIQLSPAELEFMESLKFMRMDYYMAFRVYPAMLSDMMGETGLSQGTSTDSQRVAWWEDVGISELKLIAGIVTEAARKLGIVAPAQKEFVWYNEAAIPALARQRLGKLDSLVKALGQGYRPDEINDYLDLGLPEHPDNEGRVAFSLQTIGPGAEKNLPRNTPKDAKENSELSTQKSELVAHVDRIGELCRADAEKEKAFPARLMPLRTAFDAFVKPLEKSAATRWSRFYLEQRGRVLARVNSVDVGLPTAARADAGVIVERIFPRGAEDAALSVRIRPMLTEHINAGGAFFGREMNRPSMSIDKDPAFEEAIRTREIQALKANDTTEDDIRKIWRESFEAGDTTSQFADRIAGYYKDNAIGEDSNRALTAARTMTSGLVNEGRMISARSAGGLLKTWIHSALSGEDRPAHVEAMAIYAAGIPLDATFSINGNECDAPGDSSLPADEVCNCRCMCGFVADKSGPSPANDANQEE
jgi:HK97 family phage portal protein